MRGAGLLALAAIGLAAAENPGLPDRMPQLFKRTLPQFPAYLIASAIDGEVLLELVVDARGNVQQAHAAASNNPWFERPAIDAALQWKFTPALKAGRPVNTRLRVPLYFQPEKGKSAGWSVPPPALGDGLPLDFRWDEAPVPVASDYPVYPREELVAGIKGQVDVVFVVGPDGRIDSAKIMAATNSAFAEATLASLAAWRFRPATKAGSPCFAAVRRVYEFDPAGRRGVAPVLPGARAVVEELKRRNPRIVPATELDAAPPPLTRRRPDFPLALRQAATSGDALVEVFVDRNGDAQLPRAVEASAPEFGPAAVQAVATWRFERPLKDGKPVLARVQVPVRFRRE